MPLDAICLSAVRDELAGRIIGMKIDKVQQPERDIVVLTLRGGGEPCRLLLSAGAQDARAHLTNFQFENPASPPMFCMLLRKHIVGARIVSVTQPPAERVLELVLQAPDSMGEMTEKRLVVELIGRAANIVLTDGERIIDCLRRLGGELSDKRAVLPGMIYRSPPAQEGKADPFAVSDEQWRRLFGSGGEKTADKWLLAAFSALSPLLCREISWRAYGHADYRVADIGDGGEALRREFFALTDMVKGAGYEPWSIADGEGAPQDFSFMRIGQYEGAMSLNREENFSEMLEGFYTRRAQLDRVRQRASVMLRTMNTARERLTRRLAAQREDMAKAARRETLRECGDIIMANLHRMEKGQSELSAQDFYGDEGAVRRITLDTKKTPQQNAARYYKEYAKAKNAEKYLEQQVLAGENELLYIESVIHEISLAEGERDLNEIRGELGQTGYIKAGKKGKEKPTAVLPMRFTSSSGLEILAGRNNTQNDTLTLKTALKSDVWLHAQKRTGSHVILACGGAEPDEASLVEAATIAAYYSSARSSGKTAVDYAKARFVKKPSGGRPGMVIYTNYKTIVATPDAELVDRLSRNT